MTIPDVASPADLPQQAAPLERLESARDTVNSGDGSPFAWTPAMMAELEANAVGSGCSPEEYIDWRSRAYACSQEHAARNGAPLPAGAGEFDLLAVERAIAKGMIWLMQGTQAEAMSHSMRADTDPLTRLLNRFGFESAARKIYAETPDASNLALVVLDLDNFKGVNDLLGHAQGDVVLQKVARWLTAHVRQEDLTAACGRPGGDEFVVLLNMTPSTPEGQSLTRLERATIVTERLRSSFVESVIGGNQRLTDLRFGVSIGVAFYDGPDSGDLSTWLQQAMDHADVAMYADKAQSKQQPGQTQVN